ncbi:hypothetical protein B23_3246 [Geobacillus thermoleovorans B23]|nr:hypothetical protein B23_3246 [Geobacillus thermoleovorans B23]
MIPLFSSSFNNMKKTARFHPTPQGAGFLAR